MLLPPVARLSPLLLRKWINLVPLSLEGGQSGVPVSGHSEICMCEHSCTIFLAFSEWTEMRQKGE